MCCNRSANHFEDVCMCCICMYVYVVCIEDNITRCPDACDNVQLSLNALSSALLTTQKTFQSSSHISFNTPPIDYTYKSPNYREKFSKPRHKYLCKHSIRIHWKIYLGIYKRKLWVQQNSITVHWISENQESLVGWHLLHFLFTLEF